MLCLQQMIISPNFLTTKTNEMLYMWPTCIKYSLVLGSCMNDIHVYLYVKSTCTGMNNCKPMYNIYCYTCTGSGNNINGDLSQLQYMS